MTVSADLITRFVQLFQGSARSYGQWNPKTGKAFAIKEAVALPQYTDHCNGAMGLGLVPISTDNVCIFGVIDVDTHGSNSYKDTPEAIAAKIELLKLPLIACRSKSGGTHCYVFYGKPMAAAFVRAQLHSWATQLGVGTAEIFPKQDRLAPGALGSWINLPYFDGDATNRYALIDSKRATFEQFLDAAEAMHADETTVDVNAGAFDFTQAPPCVHKIYTERRGEGHRNLSLFQASIWLKRQYPDEWKQKAEIFNRSAFAKPLDEAEFKKIMQSVAKKDYPYKCKDEPCLSLCDKPLCKTLKFGVRLGPDYANFPPIESVTKANADPPAWYVRIFDTYITMRTDDLMYFGNFRRRVMERTNQLLPPMKNEDWDACVVDMLKNKLTTLSTADGIGLNDSFAAAMQAIMRDAQTDRQEPEEPKRLRYIHDTGPAVVTGPSNKPVVMFRLVQLESRLANNYNIRTSAHILIGLLIDMGAVPLSVNLHGIVCNVWTLPPVVIDLTPPVAFKPEY